MRKRSCHCGYPFLKRLPSDESPSSMAWYRDFLAAGACRSLSRSNGTQAAPFSGAAGPAGAADALSSFRALRCACSDSLCCSTRLLAGACSAHAVKRCYCPHAQNPERSASAPHN